MAINWDKIKTEYITDATTSYRKLAEKYKISFGNICKRGRDEQWTSLRKQHSSELVTESVEAVKDAEVESFVQVQKTALYLIQRLDRCAQAKSDEELDGYFRDYAVTLKNLRDVLQTPLENRKKQAEIDALRKNLDDNEPETCEVYMDDTVRDYLV